MHSKPSTELTSISVFRAFIWEESILVLLSAAKIICSFFLINSRHTHI